MAYSKKKEIILIGETGLLSREFKYSFIRQKIPFQVIKISRKNNIKNRENHNRYKSHYEVLQRVDLSKCNQLAKQLSQCSDSYLIRIGYHSGGTIGWLGRYYIFGIFEDQNNMEFLVPLKSFENKNLAFNELKK